MYCNSLMFGQTRLVYLSTRPFQVNMFFFTIQVSLFNDSCFFGGGGRPKENLSDPVIRPRSRGGNDRRTAELGLNDQFRSIPEPWRPPEWVHDATSRDLYGST